MLHADNDYDDGDGDGNDDDDDDGGGCSRGLLPLYLEGKQLLWESGIFPFHIKTGRDDDDDGGKEDF